MVTGVYLPEFNGAVLQCASVIRHLNHQFEFEVLTGVPPPVSKHEREHNIHRFISKHSLSNILKSLWKITFLLLRKRYEIIHFHGFSKKTIPIALIGKLLNAKLILKSTSFGIDDYDTLTRKGAGYKILLRLIDTWICPAPVFRQLCLTGGINPKKVRLIPNFVDTLRFAPVDKEQKLKRRNRYGLRPDQKIVLFVGHFSHDKNPLLLFEAMRPILRADETIILMFVGRTTGNEYEVDQSIAPYIKELAKAENIAKQIVWLEREDSIEYVYQSADIFVLSSRREGLPNALLEAMSCQMSVIAYRLTGITDWIINDDSIGRIVSSQQPIELQSEIEALLYSPSQMTQTGDRARSCIVERFEANVICDALAAIYQSHVKTSTTEAIA